jgi:hypothetical protein
MQTARRTAAAHNGGPSLVATEMHAFFSMLVDFGDGDLFICFPIEVDAPNRAITREQIQSALPSLLLHAASRAT